MREVLRESHDDEDRQATAQWEADDAKRHVEELQEELEQQKEQMDNLKMQVRTRVWHQLPKHWD